MSRNLPTQDLFSESLSNDYYLDSTYKKMAEEELYETPENCQKQLKLLNELVLGE